MKLNATVSTIVLLVLCLLGACLVQGVGNLSNNVKVFFVAAGGSLEGLMKQPCRTESSSK
jgi:hypothetical protein